MSVQAAQPADKVKRRKRGTGSIYQEKASGLWAARLEVVDQVSGEKIPHVVRRKDREAAVAALEEMLAQRARGELVTNTDPRLSEWLEHWFKSISKARPRARRSQRGAITNYLTPSIGTVRLSSLGAQDVEKMHRYVINDKGLSPTTARQAHLVLQSALKAAVRQRKVRQNAALEVDKPLPAVSTMPMLSVKQSRKILNVTAEDRLGARWALALLGFRQGEALGVTLDQVRLKKKNPHIVISWQLQRLTWSHGCGAAEGKPAPCARKRGTDCPKKFIDSDPSHELRHLTGGLFLTRPKSRAGWRVVPLVDPFLTLVRDRIAASELEPNPHALLFTQGPKRVQHRTETRPVDGSPIDPARDWRTWKDILEANELPDVTVHSNRHSTVNLLLALGVSEKLIGEIVGHSAISTTRIYEHADTEQQRKALGKLGKHLGYGPA